MSLVTSVTSRTISRQIARMTTSPFVTLYQMALFDTKSTLSLALSPINSGDHQLRTNDGKDGDSNRQLVTVQVDRLDSVIDLRSLKRPIGAKIDTQGAELGIFAGGVETLAVADLISLEFWPKTMRRIGGGVELLLGHLQAHFREGRAVCGDTNEKAEWRPIHILVQELRGHWSDPNIGLRYYDVTVRK